MVKRNQFIDDDNLSELSSLTHLLEQNDNDDNEETPILQHSLSTLKISLLISLPGILDYLFWI